MVDAEQIRTALRTNWHCTAVDWVPLHGGKNSTAWLVKLGDRRCVAKVVPAAARRQFEAGLAAAERLADAGMVAGAPVRAANGALSVVAGGVVVALLRFVPGRPLDRDNPLDQQWWGDALGAAHRALAGFSHPGLARFHWVRPEAPHLAVEDWIRPAVTGAVDALARLSVTDQLCYGALHGDPAPEVFRLDIETGRTGLIDWGAAGTGPLVYDIASAVMYAGGPDRAGELIDGYRAAGPVTREELEAALPVLLRFRYAVQADYFARRIWTGDRTGCGEPADNLTGLHHARHLLDGAPGGA